MGRLSVKPFIALCIAVAFWAAPVFAQSQFLPSQDELDQIEAALTQDCAIAAPPGANQIERITWGEICTTGQVRLDYYGIGSCASERSANEDLRDVALSSKFLTEILTKNRYVAARPTPGVVLNCVYIPRLDLEERELPGSLTISQSVIETFDVSDAEIDGVLNIQRSWIGQFDGYGLISTRDVFLRDSNVEIFKVSVAKIGGNLEVSGSVFSDVFEANQVQIEDNLVMRAAQFTDVELGRARIGGYLDGNETAFSGSLIASSIAVGDSIFLRGGITIDQVDLRSSTIGGSIVASDATFPNGFYARSASLGRNITLNGVVADTVNVSRAKIGGFLTVREATIARDLDAFALQTGGSVILSGGSTFGTADLSDTTIGRNISVSGSRFETGFNASDSNIATGLNAENGTFFKEFEMNGTTLGGEVNLAGATVEGHFSAFKTSIGSDLFLREGASFDTVDLGGSKVGGHIQLQGSRFGGRVNLHGVSSEALLLWRDARESGNAPAADAYWGPDAQLILRNFKTETLQARMSKDGDDSWTREDGSRLPADLTGFTYDRLGSISSGEIYDSARIDTDALIYWVRNSKLEGMTGYRPQPYRALEVAMRNMGAEASAKEVAFARLIHRADTRVSADWRTEFGSWVGQNMTLVFDRFLQITIGFGVYPQRAFYWFIVFVVCGMVLARKCTSLCKEGADCATWGDSLFYSIENAIPLMEPSRDYENVQHEELWVRMFFHAQKVAGFILASVLIGALTLGG